MPAWLFGARRLLGMVAGSSGMGCIGFPTHPVWEVTARCNLECIHCHADSGQRDGDELTFEQARRLLREMAAVREFKMVVYSGGEPLLREDILELCEYARQLGLWVVIATNGTLLDEAKARRLRRAGVCGIAIGLDGDSPSVHDRIRGVPGAFKEAINGCIATRRAGLPLQVNFTLMRQNLDRLPGVLRLCEDLEAQVMLAYFVAPCGRGWEHKEAQLTIGQYEQSLRQIAELQRSSRLIIEPVCAPSYWAMLFSSGWFSSLLGRALGRAFFKGCVAGTGLFYVKANGEALACPFLPVSAGNVLKAGVSAVWEGSAEFERLRELRRKPQASTCAECNFVEVCGGCRARAFSSYGDFAADDPFCFLHEGADRLFDAGI